MKGIVLLLLFSSPLVYGDVVDNFELDQIYVVPYDGPTCPRKETQTKTIRISCDLKTLLSRPNMVGTDTGDCTVTKDKWGALAFECGCTTKSPLNCDLVDDKMNRALDLCGEKDGSPAIQRRCSEGFEIPGPHYWGTRTFENPNDNDYKLLMKRYLANQTFGNIPCRAIANSNLLYEQSQQKCHADRQRSRLGWAKYRKEVTNVPCCKR